MKAARPARKRAKAPSGKAAEPPASIATDADLAAHVDALIGIAPYFAALLETAGPLPLRGMDHGFRGLFWVITGQQISAAAGRAIFTRAEAALGSISPENLAATGDAALKGAGLSAPKIRTLRAASSAILAGELNLDGLLTLAPEDAISHLTTVKGVGRWTAEVYLLFALGHPDIFPAGDLALKEGVRLAFDLPERPAEKELAARAGDWRPHRSAAARLIWAYYGAVKRGSNAAPV
jgi:DNA-3-methyladenine glycosylase II